MYFALVRSILYNNLAGVLTSEKNAPQLRAILETLLTPIVESPDLRVRFLSPLIRADVLVCAICELQGLTDRRCCVSSVATDGAAVPQRGPEGR
jgi:hypothetical protein